MNYVGVEPALPVVPVAGDVLQALRTHVSGLRTSVNATDPSNDIDIAPGHIVDTSHTTWLTLHAALTKRLDAPWAVGTDQGGLDQGVKTIDTLYAVWLIRRGDTGVVDAIFSTSYFSPAMPAGYTRRALIGSVRTDASGDIIQFFQHGDWFYYRSYFILISVTSSSPVPVPYQGYVPPVAGAMKMPSRLDYTYPNSINSGGHGYLQLESGIHFAFYNHLSTGNTQAAYHSS
ncbi:MAG TPA: hypothetical protein VJ755_11775, partial [Gemmatimonadales bacterium]|nr:hypothetical protein [Gemmatimonadales bacterium]